MGKSLMQDAQQAHSFACLPESSENQISLELKLQEDSMSFVNCRNMTTLVFFFIVGIYLTRTSRQTPNRHSYIHQFFMRFILILENRISVGCSIIHALSLREVEELLFEMLLVLKMGIRMSILS